MRISANKKQNGPQYFEDRFCFKASRKVIPELFVIKFLQATDVYNSQEVKHFPLNSIYLYNYIISTIQPVQSSANVSEKHYSLNSIPIFRLLYLRTGQYADGQNY